MATLLVTQAAAITHAEEAADESWLPQTVYLHTAENGEQFWNNTNALSAADKYETVGFVTIIPQRYFT